MSSNIEVGLYVFVLATFLGVEVIRRVPKLLHTPLMALTNAISGVALVGSLVIAGERKTGLSTILGVIAVMASTINVVGGFMITDRMLRMFKKREPARVRPAAGSAASAVAVVDVSPAGAPPAARTWKDRLGATRFEQVAFTLGGLAYLAAGGLLVMVLRWAASGGASITKTFTTIAYIFGLKQPDVWIGRPVREAFQAASN